MKAMITRTSDFCVHLACRYHGFPVRRKCNRRFLPFPLEVRLLICPKILFYFAAVFTLAIFLTHGAVPKCYDHLADHFFDEEEVVLQAFSLHEVNQNTWIPMVRDLQRFSRGASIRIRRLAPQLQENPLHPFSPARAGELLAQVLFEIFQGVLNQYLITNPDAIRDMFDYIRRRQPAWGACLHSSEG